MTTNAPTYDDLIVSLNRWAVAIEGQYIDLDGYPGDYPWQCHDVWLSYIVSLFGLPVTDGHAPGVGWTDAVWREFPNHRPELAKHFTKHGGTGFRAGDVVFHAHGSAPYSLSHVTVAMTHARADGTYLAISQNPNPAQLMPVSTGGIIGFLRPITSSKINPPQEDNAMTYISIQGAAGKRRGGLYAVFHGNVAVFLGHIPVPAGVPTVTDETAIAALQARIVGLG